MWKNAAQFRTLSYQSAQQFPRQAYEIMSGEAISYTHAFS